MLDGVVEGALEGTAEGALEGAAEGAVEATLEGVAEGVLDALVEGVVEGLGEPLIALETGGLRALEATAGAELLAIEAAGVWLIDDGVSMVAGSLPLQAPIGAVNPRTTIDANRMGRSLAHLSALARTRDAVSLIRQKRRLRQKT
jgi:hypothetical protein